MLRERKAEKLDKLVQYGERVWDIRDGTPEERAEAAIAKTRNFFESLGVKTRLSDYDLAKATLSH